MAVLSIDPPLMLHELWLLRLHALQRGARGTQTSYLGYRDRYRQMATDLGFEVHVAMAEEMTRPRPDWRALLVAPSYALVTSSVRSAAAAITLSHKAAEHKRVTVLFADVTY